MATLTTTFNSPGTYISEDTYGAIPADLSDHSAVYCVVFSDQGVRDTPTFVTSLDGFTNVFGASLSAAAISLFFKQRTGTGLWIVNVSQRAEVSLTVNTAVEAEDYEVILNGFTLSYTATATDTTATIAAELGDLINKSVPSLASYYPNLLRYEPGTTVTSSANITLGAEVLAGVYPKVEDVIDTVNIAFDPEMSQGFLCCPEFYQSFTDQADRVLLANATEALVNDPKYYWINIIDCGEDIATQTTSGLAINSAIAERNLLTSVRGHSIYYFPYLTDVTDTNIPPSLLVAAVAVRRNRQEGFAQPIAGVQYPLYAVKDVTFNVGTIQQDQLNPLGINCIRRLPSGRGIVVYGARTLSTDPNYRFVSVRLIMNVLAGSLRKAFDTLILSLVDGRGALFARIKQTAANICELLRDGGALFGANSDDAYLVVCDLTNNSLELLEQGIVGLDVRVKPSPTMEVLDIRLSRASLSAVLAEVVNSGDISDVNQA